MDIVIELLGTARIAAKRKVVNLQLPDGATGRDVIVALAEAVPALKGDVVDPIKRELVPPQLLGDGAGRTVPDLDAPLDPDTARGLFIFLEPC